MTTARGPRRGMRGISPVDIIIIGAGIGRTQNVEEILSGRCVHEEMVHVHGRTV